MEKWAGFGGLKRVTDGKRVRKEREGVEREPAHPAAVCEERARTPLTALPAPPARRGRTGLARKVSAEERGRADMVESQRPATPAQRF